MDRGSPEASAPGMRLSHARLLRAEGSGPTAGARSRA
jgi:hypothetical protein